MPENNQMMSLEGQLVGMPLAGPESFSQQQLNYLKRALGVDETVLWEGTPTSSSYQITLSENLSNFEYFAVEWKSYERRYRDNFNAATTTQSITLGACFVNTDGNYEKSLTTWGTTDGSAYSWKATIHGGFQSSQSSSWNSNVVPLRIIGIHRIAGGNT